MMKKTLKQVLSLTLGMTMVIGMAGCSKEAAPEETKAAATQAVSKETTAASATETAAPAATAEGVTYPLDTDAKFTFWTHRYPLSDAYANWTESPFHTGLIEMTGVDLEYMMPNKGQDHKEAYNLVMADEEIPNIFLRATNINDLTELYNDGVIYDLTPYVEEYAPDYWKFITSDESIYREATTTDGKVLGFFSSRESQWSNTFLGPMIRQDWLDECGLEAPVTLADWENVLRTFKEKYNATLGLEAGHLKNCFFASGTGAMYTSPGNVFFKDDNDEVQVICMQPEWKEYMQILQDWYAEGLIDKDSVTMDTAALRTKAANDQIGASWSAMSRMTYFVQDAEANGSSANWVGVSYPRTAPGEPTVCIPVGSLMQNTVGFITTSTPKEQLIDAIKFMNYGYSEEGRLYINFGKEGVSYTLDGEGKPNFTELVTGDPAGLNDALTKYTGGSAAPLGFQMDDMVRQKNVPVVSEAVDIWQENTVAEKYFYTSSPLTEDEQLEYTDKMAMIKTYIQEQVQKYMLGTESVDDIDKFYAELEKMGINDILEIERAAYARQKVKVLPK